MESATLSSRTLEIDGMKGDACVQKVTGALKGITDVTTTNVKVGQATVEADDTGCKAACAAIDGAGFTCRDAAKADGATGHGPSTAHNGASNKPATNTGNAKPAPANTAAAKPGDQRPATAAPAQAVKATT